MNKIDTCLDLLYEYIDMLLCCGQFEEVNEILATISIPESGTNVLIGLLTLTLVPRSLLNERETFYMNVEAELKKRDCWSDDLLVGLK